MGLSFFLMSLAHSKKAQYKATRVLQQQEPKALVFHFYTLLTPFQNCTTMDRHVKRCVQDTTCETLKIQSM
jgi:hypothetical protein